MKSYVYSFLWFGRIPIVTLPHSIKKRERKSPTDSTEVTLHPGTKCIIIASPWPASVLHSQVVSQCYHYARITVAVHSSDTFDDDFTVLLYRCCPSIMLYTTIIIQSHQSGRIKASTEHIERCIIYAM